ncbi:VanW family protein [Guggenheimella bovis]
MRDFIRSILHRFFPKLLKWKRELHTWRYQRKLKKKYSLASLQSEKLPYEIFRFSLPVIVEGQERKYQENKRQNLLILKKRFDGLVIRPFETFSFLDRQYGADKDTPYKEALVIVRGELKTEEGGGLCMLSNMIFYALLHTPLEIIERHTHRKKYFKDQGNLPKGIDATILQGWLDLKAFNPTKDVYQLDVSIDEKDMHVAIRSSSPKKEDVEIFNKNVVTTDTEESVEVWRRDKVLGKEEFLYVNRQLLGEVTR